MLKLSVTSNSFILKMLHSTIEKLQTLLLDLIYSFMLLN